MKTGELVIMWIGGLLAVYILLDFATPSPRMYVPWTTELRMFPGRTVAAIFIVCLMVWATIYKRKN
jgi:hypothetical protein